MVKAIKKNGRKSKAFRYWAICLGIAIWLLAIQRGLSAEVLHTIIYVDHEATGSADGSSWEDAYPNLQDALAAVSGETEIWVAEGVYYPDDGGGQANNDRSTTFTLANNVSLYGGFDGTETALEQRDVTAHMTVLSGDIDQDDTADGNGIVANTDYISGNNAYHVVTAISVDNTAVLDGFIVTAGQANVNSGTNADGGGMYTSAAEAIIRYVTFSGNFASNRGGGMYNIGGSPTVEQVNFNGNSTDSNANTSYGGGGMYNRLSTPTISYTTFYNNSTVASGGGMSNFSSSPVISHTTFSNNSASIGGGIVNSSGSPVISHSTFSGNGANSGGGIHNKINSDPTLSNVLIANSTGGDCINASDSVDSVVDGGYNFMEDSGDDACGVSHNVNGNIIGQGTAQLEDLADNGGYTQTHLPSLGSIVIDQGNGCSGNDQRGEARPFDQPNIANSGDGCDIGSVEMTTTIYKSYLPVIVTSN